MKAKIAKHSASSTGLIGYKASDQTHLSHPSSTGLIGYMASDQTHLSHPSKAWRVYCVLFGATAGITVGAGWGAILAWPRWPTPWLVTIMVAAFVAFLVELLIATCVICVVVYRRRHYHD